MVAWESSPMLLWKKLDLMEKLHGNRFSEGLFRIFFLVPVFSPSLLLLCYALTRNSTKKANNKKLSFVLSIAIYNQFLWFLELDEFQSLTVVYLLE